MRKKAYDWTLQEFMKTSTLALGSLLCAWPQETKGSDNDGRGFAKPAHLDTPVLYDVTNPGDVFAAMKRNADMHFAYAEQVLAALENGTRSDSLPKSTPGTFTVNVNPDGKGGWIVSGFTKMEPGSPYVFADNIVWTMPGCGKEGRSHLTHRFSQEGTKESVSQSVWTSENPEDTTSTVNFRNNTLSTVGRVDADRMQRYDEIAQRVVCNIEAALK